MRGSVIAVQGVCSAVANERLQLVGIRLWVPSMNNVHVSQAMPANPFSVPARPIASLRQFNTLPEFNRRVRVTGVVLYQSPGSQVYIQDGAECLLVLSRDTESLAPGDRIETVGFPGREGGRVVLREAVYRRLAGGGEPTPTPLALDDSGPIPEGLDGHLVRITATLLESTSRERDSRLTLQSGATVFEALQPGKDGRRAGARLAPGSVLALVGIYQIDFDEFRHARGFKLQLRSATDIAVLRSPPWWNARRALTAVWALVVCSLFVVAWVATLRRRVRRQTDQIREQVQREDRLKAELQHSAKLESLGILAGGIAHDFNNLLTVIMGNVTLARLDAPENKPLGSLLREAEKGVIRARDLTLQLLTFAKGGDPVRKAVGLADIVHEAATFALHGANVRCDFDTAPDLWPADVDKGQIGQVVHNIVINAVQAMPGGGTVRLLLENEPVAEGGVPGLTAGRYLKLAITDTGSGIDPATLPRIFDPYFTTKAQGSGLGLATVYSIIKKHAGRIEVESTVGRGTTFRIWLPAAEDTPVDQHHSEPPSFRFNGRALLMDDDEAIRRLAAALLQRLGLEAKAVSDGNEAVREYEAARAAGQPYNVVILDLTVPGGMGGRETMEKLRQLDPDVRAVVSSGYSSDPVVAQYQSYGFSGIVTKPYDLTELTKALNAALTHGGRH
jgi:signal transduction histidine kinase/CheY-like chemotaxis protein